MNMGGEDMLTCSNVSWDVKGHRILHTVNVSIIPGAMTGIVGRNGSGKTTLVHLLAGLLSPSQGTVFLGDRDISTIPRKHVAQKIALLEQLPTARVELTVREVVALGRIPHESQWHRGRANPIVDRAMEYVDVSSLAHRSWNTLSGGERQRVQLARALAQEPTIMLLDEPTNHLDLNHQIHLLRMVKERGITTVAVLHDVDLTAAFVDMLIVMDAGHLVAYGSPEKILSRSFVREHFLVDGESHRTDRLRFMWRDAL